jgi:hypothetical protein
LKSNGKELPKTADIAVSSSTINGPKAVRHAKDGDALPVQMWAKLPEMMAEPLAVLYDENKKTMLYVLPEMSAKRGQLVVEFDFQRKDQRNMLVSAYRPLLVNLLNRIENKTLTLMRGELE